MAPGPLMGPARGGGVGPSAERRARPRAPRRARPQGRSPATPPARPCRPPEGARPGRLQSALSSGLASAVTTEEAAPRFAIIILYS